MTESERISPASPPAAGAQRGAAERSSRGWTVLELLRWTTGFFEEKGLTSARLDAECLLAHALDCDRLRLYLDHDKPIEPAERARFREFVRQRADERVPVALLTGRREFWSLSFRVDRHVLVPRPETETLVAATLESIPDREAELRVLDLGTGSGAVALALASELPKSRITASDVSPAALEVARANASALGFADRVQFVSGDGFEPVVGERFDRIVSNPPYLAEAEAASLPPELRHEPHAALFAGPDGTRLLRRIAAEAAELLSPDGVLAVELAPEQAEPMRGWLVAAGLGRSEVRRDLAGRARVVVARRGESAGADRTAHGEGG